MFDNLFGIIELSLRCRGGRNSEDEIDSDEWVRAVCTRLGGKVVVVVVEY